MFDQPFSELSGPLVSLVLTSAVVMGSPGPSTISVTAVGAAFGFRRSLGYAGGLALGTTAVLLLVASGLFALLLSLPGLAPVLVAGSAAYLAYLAWRIATAPPLADVRATSTAPTIWEGFLLAVANPKAYVAIAAVFAGSALGAGSTKNAVLKTIVLAAMIVAIHLGWLLAGASFARVLRDPVRSRFTNVAFALALVASVLLPLFR